MRPLWIGAVIATTIATVALGVPSASSAAAAVGVPSSTVIFRSDGATNITLAIPSSSEPGDLLVASVAYAARSRGDTIDVTAPSGWTVVAGGSPRRVSGLAVYTHVVAAGEREATWRTSDRVSVVAMMAGFSGVDPTNPLDGVQTATSTDTASVTVPSLTTSLPDSAVVALFSQHREKGGLKVWSAPASMSEIGDQQTGNKRISSSVHVAERPVAGPVGEVRGTAGAKADNVFGVVLALRPASAETTVPMVQDPRATPATDRATIAWNTDVPADSQVEFGRDETYGQRTPLDSSLVISHVVQLGGLVPDTEYHYRVRSSTSAGVATSTDLVFRTLAEPSNGPVPLIVDTDIFSDADDVTALATAFGLQLRGEARVLAIGVNTRTSRPAVSSDSWRCAAAVAHFYGAGAVPIGTSLPNNGTERNQPDFVKPCAALAPSNTPVPESAVSVYRRTLAAQPDGSVVFVTIGYLGNLRALLASGADASSPLSGRALVAQKVKRLVSMGGGYPSWPSENNFRGDIAAAQSVMTEWPTRIEFAGYEVGDLIKTGQTISSVHPTTSPVRVAYEAFVRPGNWIYSYDLVAVYRAVRPNELLLGSSGPGRNVVDANGGNAFTADPAGPHAYLLLPNADALNGAIEALLGVLPAASADQVPPTLSNVDVSAGTTEATVTWATDEPATSQVDFGPALPYASQTPMVTSLSTTHSVRITGLSPAVSYHFRVRSLDAAGNETVSPNGRFLTTGTASGGGSTVIYDDALVNAEDWGWAPRDYASTSPVQSGARAISVRADPWTGLQIGLRTPFRVTAGSMLEFWVNGEAGGQQITVELFNSNARMVMIPLGTLPVNSWRKVQLDLRDFAVGDNVTTIIFYAGTPTPGGRYSLDNIRFTS